MLKQYYSYDLKNNMVSATSSNVTGNYNFNALNQRVSKTVNGVTTYFVYNENHQLIGEYDSNGNVISEHIYFGLRPVALYQNNQMYKVHSDYLGTPRIVTDSNNSPVWKWLNLNAYGSNLPSLESITYNLRFAGQYFDNESKLHYNYYRTYNPETGRYMQSDPIGLAAGANTYNYVGGNPLNGVDPLGLCPCGDVNKLIKIARSDKRDWTKAADRTDIHQSYGPDTNKCNLFVDTQYEAAGYNLPNIGGRFFSRWQNKFPPGANALSDAEYEVPGWPVVQGPPQPGDLMALSGHVGISTGGKNIITTGSYNPVSESPRFIYTSKAKWVIRRCSCK